MFTVRCAAGFKFGFDLVAAGKQAVLPLFLKCPGGRLLAGCFRTKKADTPSALFAI